MKSAENKNETKTPLGVTVISIANFVFGFAGILVGFLGFYIQPNLSLYALVISSMLFVSGIGLLELKRWAWYLAVLTCVTSLVLYLFLPSKGFPLEIVILPYLLWKREIFGIKFGRR